MDRVQIFEGVSSEVAMVHHLLVRMRAKFFLGVVAPTLLLFKLESAEGKMMYNPQWVVTQSSYNQGVVPLTVTWLLQAPGG